MNYFPELTTESFQIDESLVEKANSLEKRRENEKKIAPILSYSWLDASYALQDISSENSPRESFFDTIDLLETTIIVKSSQARYTSDYSRPFITVTSINQIASVDKSISPSDVKDVKTFLDKILQLQNEDKMSALELIYDKFYALFKSKKYSLADYVFKSIDITKLEITCSLAFLTSTLPFKSQLSAREELFNSIQKYLIEKMPDRASALLKGLN